MHYILITFQNSTGNSKFLGHKWHFFDNMLKNFWRHFLSDLSYLIKATKRLIKNWRGIFKFTQVLKLLYVTNDVLIVIFYRHHFHSGLQKINLLKCKLG